MRAVCIPWIVVCIPDRSDTPTIRHQSRFHPGKDPLLFQNGQGALGKLRRGELSSRASTFLGPNERIFFDIPNYQPDIERNTQQSCDFSLRYASVVIDQGTYTITVFISGNGYRTATSIGITIISLPRSLFFALKTHRLTVLTSTVSLPNTFNNLR